MAEKAANKTNGDAAGPRIDDSAPAQATVSAPYANGQTSEKPVNGAVNGGPTGGKEGKSRNVAVGRLASLPIEELVYYANEQRREYGLHTPGGPKMRWFSWFDNHFGPNTPDNPLDYNNALTEECTAAQQRADFGAEFEKDKADARRALRTASWGMMFYLITTDVIGPNNAPYAFSTVGYVGGILLYLVFGIAAYYSSFLILNLFLRLDSSRHPIQTYGEMMEVFFGITGHYLVTVVQVLQIFFIVGSNVIACAQSMTQLTAPHGSLCFIVSIVVWTIIGALTSIPFRSLSKLSYLASFDVFINLLVIFISMGFIAHSPPNYVSAAATYGFTPPYAPIMHSATGSGPLSDQVNGAMNMVFGWSGLMIFVEFINEMRRPWEFVKSFTTAEFLVLIVYLVYGAYGYGLQGQYVLPVAFQGVSKYVWQSIGNGLSLWTYNMASVTYLNIAVKVLYWLLFEEVFRGPALMSTKGFFYWTGLQCFSWAISFIIGTAIPQVQTIQALVGAAFLLQFSYTWPPMMQLAFDIQADASKQDGLYVPGSPPKRQDSWRSWSRWKRGLFTGRVAFKGANFLYMTAALATCGLGIWGSVETIKATFQTSSATSFGCSAPV